MNELWRRMTAIYGHKWSSQYGDCDADDTWAKGLADITPEQLGHGLRECLKVGSDRKRTGDEDWPPTLGEFRAYCKPVRHACHDTYAALPKPEMSIEEKEAAIQKCREAL
jgi:hypothetical protein